MPHNTPEKRREYSRMYIKKNKKKHRERNKKWRRNNPEYDYNYGVEYRKKNAAVIKVKKRDYVLRKTYGLSIYKWNKMYDLQKGNCAICNIHQSKLSKILNVDHCHNTNKIRDLLCDKCNLTVGYVENCNIDDILNYIKKHKEKLN